MSVREEKKEMQQQGEGDQIVYTEVVVGSEELLRPSPTRPLSKRSL